ncbi:regulator [Vibrio cholerae]|nr:regulator [Vibrio cholerae]EGR1312100.1 regulator [Vibrio cholerae]
MSINNSINDDVFMNLSLLDTQSIEDCLSTLRKKNRVGLDQLKSIFDLGVEFYNKFQFKEAEMVFSAYASLNPYDHRGVGSLASIYLEQHKFSKALEALNILKTYPTCDFDETMLNISLCYYKLEQFTNAVATHLIVRPESLSAFNVNRYNFLKKQLNPYF